MLQEQEELAYEFGQSYKPPQARMRMPKLESKKGKESTQLLGPFQLWAKNWMSKGMYTLHGFVPCKFLEQVSSKTVTELMVRFLSRRTASYSMKLTDK